MRIARNISGEGAPATSDMYAVERPIDEVIDQLIERHAEQAIGQLIEPGRDQTIDIESSQKNQCCSEWSRLVDRYRSAVAAYCSASSALGPVPGMDFDAAWQRSEESRRRCEDSRAELWHHEQAHGCSRGRPKQVEQLEELSRRLAALK